ncbi:hypothetical protein I541_5632 [Mycobacteroides abscessus]|uniref:hypothetical protein n=1 Tax=Mycobacteroides abscessus TaxID=36809 RepID=UPI000447482B|nr:hypothetical protein I541_5632 [Mycobacteroides abscessus]
MSTFRHIAGPVTTSSDRSRKFSQGLTATVRDELAGCAAHSDAERAAARWVLAECRWRHS